MPSDNQPDFSRLEPQKNPKKTPAAAPAMPDDPIVYAGLINNFLTDRNPLHAIAGDLKRKFGMMGSINRNMKTAQRTVEKIQDRIERIELIVDQSHPKQSGTRLDKLR